MIERAVILAALERAGGRVSGSRGAAEILGPKPTTLFSRMTVLGLRKRPLEESATPVRRILALP